MIKLKLLPDSRKVSVGKCGRIIVGIVFVALIVLLFFGSDKQKELSEISLSWIGVIFFTFLSWSKTIQSPLASGNYAAIAMLCGILGAGYNLGKFWFAN